VAENHVS